MSHDAAEPLEAAAARKPPEPEQAPAAPAPAPPARSIGALFDTGLGVGMGPPSPTALVRQLARSSVTDRKAGIEDLNERIGNRRVTRMLATATLQRRVNKAVVEKIGEFDEIIDRVAKEEKVSAALIRGIIASESGGDEFKRSPTGYKGLMQSGRSGDKDATDAAGLGSYDPETSIKEGTAKIKQFTRTLKKMIGTQMKTLGIKEGDTSDPNFVAILMLSYNAGPGTVAKAVRLAGAAGELTLWRDAKYYVPALLSTGAYDHKLVLQKLKGLEPKELATEYEELTGEALDSSLLPPEEPAAAPAAPGAAPPKPAPKKKGKTAAQKAAEKIRAKIVTAANKQRNAYKKKSWTPALVESDANHLMVHCAEVKTQRSGPYVEKILEYMRHFGAATAAPVTPAATPKDPPDVNAADKDVGGSGAPEGVPERAPPTPGRGSGAPSPREPALARWPAERVLARQSPPVAPPAPPDVTKMPQADLESEQAKLKERVDTPESYADRAQDEARLAAVQAELSNRSNAAVERAPLGGLLDRLDKLSKAAAGESGGADTGTSVDDFKKSLAARVAALAPGEPLPEDVRIVMEALILWAADKGDQWGEGAWDSKDLQLSASEYVKVPASHNKCNAYVAESVHKSVGVVHKGHAHHEQAGKWFPFRAAEWSDPAFNIPDFALVTTPKMGDVCGFGGHLGIYLSTYGDRILYISARDNAIGVYGEKIQHTHGIQIKLQPAKDVKTYRRHTPGAGHPAGAAGTGAGGADAGVPGGPDAGVAPGSGGAPADAGVPGGVP